MPKNYAVEVHDQPLALRRKGDGIVIFRDPGPILSRAYDFRKFGLARDMEGSLADGYFEYCRNKSVATRDVCYITLGHFARFVREYGFHGDNGDPMRSFASFLERQKKRDGDFWTKKTCHWHYSNVTLVLRVLKHRIGAAWLDVSELPGLPYSRHRARTTRRGLEITQHQAELIVAAAQKEITALRLRVGPFIPTSNDLIPYIVLIGAATFANSGPLRKFPRDCLIPHPVDQERTVVAWFKLRSNRQQHRTFIDKSPWGPPMLIREVQNLTACVVRYVAPKDTDRLFICNKPRNGEPYNMGILGQCSLDAATERFIVRNNLPSFRMSMLRLAGLAHSYKKLGGDIRRVQFLANHTHPNTTREYVDTYINREDDEAIIAELQAAFQARFIESVSDTVATAAMLGVDNETAEAISHGRNATLSGFTCKNPLAGIAPGQKRGQICTHWLGCFTCPNAVITSETRSVARLLQLRDHLEAAMGEMHIQRWRLLYMPIVAIIERDILPKLTDTALAAGRTFMATLPALPEIINR